VVDEGRERQENEDADGVGLGMLHSLAFPVSVFSRTTSRRKPSGSATYMPRRKFISTHLFAAIGHRTRTTYTDDVHDVLRPAESTIVEYGSGIEQD
jgi:hypothetical protein